jgi:hypothetical protein
MQSTSPRERVVLFFDRRRLTQMHLSPPEGAAHQYGFRREAGGLSRVRDGKRTDSSIGTLRRIYSVRDDGNDHRCSRRTHLQLVDPKGNPCVTGSPCIQYHGCAVMRLYDEMQRLKGDSRYGDEFELDREAKSRLRSVARLRRLTARALRRFRKPRQGESDLTCLEGSGCGATASRGSLSPIPGQ